MNARALLFWVPALLSTLAVLRVATLPIGILYDGGATPSTDVLMRAAFFQSLPVLAPGALLLFIAWFIHARGGLARRWVLMLIAAPVVTFTTLYFSLGWDA